MFPAKPSRENARACVLGVEISEIIVRIVTALPPQKPDRHLNAIICQTLRDSPNKMLVTESPRRLATSIGFLPLYTCTNLAY
jgi:hypothetical protein